MRSKYHRQLWRCGGHGAPKGKQEKKDGGAAERSLRAENDVL
jgi:hypothetical protein